MIRGLVRSVGDEVPGLLVGVVRLGTGGPAPLDVDMALADGTVLPMAVDALRAALRAVLPGQVPFAVERSTATSSA